MRTPLRPLASILRARAHGENPDLIERENLAVRNEAMRERTHSRAAARLGLLGLSFAAFFLTIGIRTDAPASAIPPADLGLPTFSRKGRR